VDENKSNKPPIPTQPAEFVLMPTYPDYVYKTLVRARDEGQWYCGQPAATVVDWSFLDKDDGQPGEPADWVKKNIKRLERWGEGDELHQEMLEEMKRSHQWTRNILPPSMPKRYDPNATPFDPSEILGGMEDDDLDEI
jgi:hypothetical protein